MELLGTAYAQILELVIDRRARELYDVLSRYVSKQIYQGYIDDARNVARVHNHGLRDAIESAIAGKTVANPQTRAFGCTIKKARRSS